MTIDNNTVALIGLTLVVIVALAFRLDGAKEIALALGGAIGGWMAKAQ